VGRLSRGRLFQCLGHLPGMQGRRSRVPPLVGDPPGDFTKSLLLQKCPCPNWRTAQSTWCWSAYAVVTDLVDCGCALMEGAAQGAEAGAVWLEDRGLSPKGPFRSLEIELRAVTRRESLPKRRTAPAAPSAMMIPTGLEHSFAAADPEVTWRLVDFEAGAVGQPG
jgi:hypothetical protein